MPLTGTVDAANARIDLFIDYVPVSGTQLTATLIRHTGSVDAPGEYVRGLFGGLLLGEQAYVSDHEAPLDKQIWYTVVSPETSEVMTAGPFTIPSNGYVWMKDPGRPWADLRLDLCLNPSTSVAVCETEPQISDTFTRTVAAAWGTADTGQTWTDQGGVAGDFSVSGGQGRHLLTSTASRRGLLNSPQADVDIQADVGVDVVAIGAPITASLMGRHVDANNTYVLRLVFSPDGTYALEIMRRAAAVETVLATSTIGPYTAGTMYTLRFQIQGSELRGRTWPVGVAEGEAWTVRAVDGTFTAAGFLGTRSIISTGNLNAGPSALYDNFSVNQFAPPGDDDIAWVGFQEKDRAADAGQFPVLDKERPANIYARRKDITTGALFLSRSLPAIDDIYFLYTVGGPLLFQVPSIYGMEMPANTGHLRDRYYQPDTLKEDYLSQDQRKPLRLWSVPLVSVDAPIGEPQGTDTANWCALSETYPTFADLTASGYSWSQVASGEASSINLPNGGYGSGPYGAGPYGG